MSYKRIADQVQAEIDAGGLRPGDRLPPQREFADIRGIAMSTATRVYGELVRRGVVVGEVGRGTFVRTGPPAEGLALAQGIGNRINLATNIPLLPHHAGVLSRSTAAMTRRSTVIASAMSPVLASGTPAARQTVAAFMSRGTWQPSAERINFTGNGRQALAAALAAVGSSGQRVGVEALSYQSVAGIAAGLGLEVVPLRMDKYGLRVDGVIEAHRRAGMRAIYVQPTLHNPLGLTMPSKRRQELARVLTDLDLVAVEDHVYAFLIDDHLPLASLVPEHAVMIDSLSKRIAPGLTLGWALAPARLVQPIAEAIRASALVPSGLALELCLRWIADGTVARLVKDKRRDAVMKQRLLRKSCPELAIQADPRAYHAWIELPVQWRSESFTAAAAAQGIAVAPAAAFAVAPGHAPNAVRVALGSTPPDVLAGALRRLNSLVRLGPSNENLE
jgi:DNA-binding transcriptional MocR family regulator